MSKSNRVRPPPVFDMNDKFIVSVGANGYSDYPTYLQQGDKALADKRRQ